MNFWILVSISSTVSLPYSVMRFIGVLVESAIMTILAPASIHPDCLALSANFSLNRLMYLESLSNSSVSFRMDILNSLLPMVQV